MTSLQTLVMSIGFFLFFLTLIIKQYLLNCTLNHERNVDSDEMKCAHLSARWTEVLSFTIHARFTSLLGVIRSFWWRHSPIPRIGRPRALSYGSLLGAIGCLIRYCRDIWMFSRSTVCGRVRSVIKNSSRLMLKGAHIEPVSEHSYLALFKQQKSAQTPTFYRTQLNT